MTQSDRIKELKARKASLRFARQLESSALRERQRLSRHCFWTWPWGHMYKWDGVNDNYRVCQVCFKRRDGKTGKVDYVDIPMEIK